MDDLNTLRQEIDHIDKEMLTLFEKRMKLVLEIAQFKAMNNLEILDESREQKVLEKTEYVQAEHIKKYAASFLQDLMNVSKQLQAEHLSHSKFSNEAKEISIMREDIQINRAENIKTIPLTVGFQGIPGSYSEEALRDYFGENVNSKNYVNFEDVFKALQSDEIEYGVLPIENSFTGGIAEVYDLLCRYGFYIIGEKCVHVDHNLLVLQGAKEEDIQEIYSHPQALQQCSKFLRAHPKWNTISCTNTAVSAKIIQDSGSLTKAAIASRRAAELYGLTILTKGINNNIHNFTRFIIIGRNNEYNQQSDKISLALTIPHEPGSLHRILGCFSKNELNMLKIESRPMTDRTWEYLFHIDFEGNLDNQEVIQALRSIAKDSTFYRLLGNYRGDSK